MFLFSCFQKHGSKNDVGDPGPLGRSWWIALAPSTQLRQAGRHSKLVMAAMIVSSAAAVVVKTFTLRRRQNRRILCVGWASHLSLPSTFFGGGNLWVLSSVLQDPEGILGPPQRGHIARLDLKRRLEKDAVAREAFDRQLREEREQRRKRREVSDAFTHPSHVLFSAASVELSFIVLCSLLCLSLGSCGAGDDRGTDRVFSWHWSAGHRGGDREVAAPVSCWLLSFFIYDHLMQWTELAKSLPFHVGYQMANAALLFLLPRFWYLKGKWFSKSMNRLDGVTKFEVDKDEYSI